MAQTDALLRFFFKIETDNLNDEEFAEMTAKMWWALKATGNVKEENGKLTFIK